MKRIDFEAHFITSEFLDIMMANKGYPRYAKDPQGRTMVLWSDNTANPIGNALLSKLLDLGEGRLAEMDAAGIDVQMLTLAAPGIELLEPNTAASMARRTNDRLAAAVRKHPDRFQGYCALAVHDPEEAADELERSVKELGLKGWKTHSNYGDSYLDEKKYWPILERAARLNAPIYLHPSFPAIAQLKTSYGFALAGAAFGFGFETAMCMMRLILSGVFDRYPTLTFILGHLGEAMPFLYERMDNAYLKPAFDPRARPDLARKPSEYFKDNVLVTTSGNYHPPAFVCTKETLGMDRILFGTDYPYEDNAECIRFLEGLGLTESEKAKLYSQNAAHIGVGV